eukprot:1046768-Pyramimonas_sp.AAC.1
MFVDPPCPLARRRGARPPRMTWKWTQGALPTSQGSRPQQTEGAGPGYAAASPPDHSPPAAAPIAD